MGIISFFCCDPPFDYVCTHERLSVGYHDTPRAPSFRRIRFSRLRKRHRLQRKKEIRQMFTLPRESTVMIHLKSAEATMAFVSCNPTRLLCHPPFATCCRCDPRKEFNSKLNILSSPPNRIFQIVKESNLSFAVWVKRYPRAGMITISVNI